MSTDQSPETSNGDAERIQTLTLEISNAMERIYETNFGRGPAKTRTHWSDEDLITVTLEDTLTPVERSMVDMGEHQRLRDARMLFQYGSVREFCDSIEVITGRKVRAFISGIDTAVEGYSVELFALHPEGYDGPSRADKAEV